MKRTLFFALLSLYMVCAEQWYQITPTWRFNQTQLDLFVSKLEKTTDETFMYHWGDGFSGLRYAQQNYVDQEEMDILNAGSGVGGGGFYFSKDKYDSSLYGSFPTAVRLPAGTLLFNSYDNSGSTALVRTILDYPSSSLLESDKVKLGAVIPFVDEYYYYETWRVTHSAKLLQDVMPGHIAPKPHNVEFWADTESYSTMASESLNQTKHREMFDKWKDNINDIERLFSLLSLLGITEMNCRLGLKEDIWQGVDSQQFENFHKLRMLVYQMIRDQTYVGFGYYDYGGLAPRNAASLWARNQTETVLPELYSKIHGSADNMWRDEEKTVHVGNGTVTVVDKQLEYIKSNPYLHIKVVSTDANNRTQVQIWLPDVLHYKSTLVTNTTDALIKSYTVTQLESDSKLRQKLNRVLNKDMLDNMLLSVFGSSYDLDLCKQLVFLSPLSDMELAKMWCWLGTIELQKNPQVAPPDVIYRGIEFLFKPSIFASDQFYRALKQGSFTATNNATMSTVLHMGDHIHNPEEKGWYTDGWNVSTLYKTPYYMNFTLPLDQCEMVREKRWTEILDEHYPRWINRI